MMPMRPAFVLALTIISCGQTGSSANRDGASAAGGGGGEVATTGTGGQAQDGGANDRGGHAGDGASVASAHWPTCLLTLFSQCSLIGACTDQPLGTVHCCFANDVTTSETSTGDCGSDDIRQESTYRKGDGSPCFVFEKRLRRDMACEGGSATWKNASGETVATASISFGQTVISCTTTGETLTRLSGAFNPVPPICGP